MNKARASVSVIDPIANVSFVLPVAAVSYLELVASAELDQTGRYPYAVDTYIVADASLVDFAKALQSGVDTTEAINAFGFGKSLSDDSVTVPDEIFPILILLKDFIDDTYANDVDLLEFGKNLIEAVAASHGTPTADYAKNLTENQEILEALAVGFAGALDDIAPVGDIVNFINGFARVFDETMVAEDVYDRVVEWNPPFDEDAPVIEQISNGLEKPFADGSTIEDDSVQSVGYARSFEDSNISLVGSPATLNGMLLNDNPINDSPGAETFNFDFGKNPEEVLLAGESFDRVVTWFPEYVDTTLISELLTSDFSKSLTDAPAATESIGFANVFSRSFEDEFGAVDIFAANVAPGISDSISTSDDLSYEKASSQPALLNTGLLNTTQLNAS